MNLKKIHLERGLSHRTIQEVEKRDTCSVSTAIKLADALDVTLDELCRDNPQSKE